jgi:hypothetical protein
MNEIEEIEEYLSTCSISKNIEATAALDMIGTRVSAIAMDGENWAESALPAAEGLVGKGVTAIVEDTLLTHLENEGYSVENREDVLELLRETDGYYSVLSEATQIMMESMRDFLPLY